MIDGILDRIERAVNNHKEMGGEPNTILLGLNELQELNHALYLTDMERNVGQMLDEIELFDCKLKAHLGQSLIATLTVR